MARLSLVSARLPLAYAPPPARGGAWLGGERPHPSGVRPLAAGREGGARAPAVGRVRPPADQPVLLEPTDDLSDVGSHAALVLGQLGERQRLLRLGQQSQ